MSVNLCLEEARKDFEDAYYRLYRASIDFVKALDDNRNLVKDCEKILKHAESESDRRLYIYRLAIIASRQDKGEVKE